MEQAFGWTFAWLVTLVGLGIGLGGPAGIAHVGTTERLRWWMVPLGIVILLFCGLMAANNASHMIPALNAPVATAVCPCGFDTLTDRAEIHRWDLPGFQFTLERELVCTGELGRYPVSRPLFVLSGMALYMLFATAYVALALLIGKRTRVGRSRPMLAEGIAAAVVLSALGVSLVRPAVVSPVTTMLNRLYYRGHAISLVEAVARGRTDYVRMLLDKGGDIRAKNHEGVSALAMVQQIGDKQTLELFAAQITGGSAPRAALLQKGIVFDEKGFFAQVRAGDTNNVALFLEGGFDINALEDGRWSALAIAAQDGHAGMVRFLLSRGADVELMGRTGWTPLCAAAISCKPEMVELLIERGADVEHATDHGDTPLMMASRAGCTQAVTALLRAGAKVNTRERIAGYSALLFAVEYGGRNALAVAAALLEHGADPNVRIYSGTYRGMSPLDIARMGSSKPDVAELLLKYGARE